MSRLSCRFSSYVIGVVLASSSESTPGPVPTPPPVAAVNCLDPFLEPDVPEEKNANDYGPNTDQSTFKIPLNLILLYKQTHEAEYYTTLDLL